MIKSILTSTAIFFASIPAAFAGNPGVAIGSVPTPYGQTGCIQRSLNKFYAIGATGITSSSDSVWGYTMNSTLGVWCRGTEAIVVVAGENESNLRAEIKSAL